MSKFPFHLACMNKVWNKCLCWNEMFSVRITLMAHFGTLNPQKRTLEMMVNRSKYHTGSCRSEPTLMF